MFSFTCVLSCVLFLIFVLQIVSRLVQIRDYITKASSMREDLVEKNERSANVERLTHLIDHLKEQEKSYMKFLQKILVSFEPFKIRY
jgi:Tfp pilus assembly protein PilO